MAAAEAGTEASGLGQGGAEGAGGEDLQVCLVYWVPNGSGKI